MKIRNLLTPVAWIVVLLAAPAARGQLQLERGHFCSGGGVSHGGHTLQQTIGEPVVGVSTGAEHIVRHGFWGFWQAMLPTSVPYLLPPGPTELYQNFPNPFNPATTIAFNLQQRSTVRLSIYNLKGMLVRTLILETLPEGRHAVVWDGTDNSGRTVGSDVYIYRMITDHTVHANRLLLLK